MKKILIFTILIVLIPFFIVTFLIKDEIKKEIKLKIKDDYIIKIKREDNSIIEVPFEDYIVGVVAAEMPAEFELEALKAQAVAARSYVLKKIEQNKNNDYDILDTTMNQVYISDDKMKEKWTNKYDEYLKKIKQAVEDTKGQYLTYNGTVIEAFFFSTSSGKTENSEEVFSKSLPYLRSVDSSWDNISPAFNSKNTFSLDEFYFNLNIPYSDNLIINVLETTSTGRIKKIKINNKEFTGNEIRDIFKLKSTFFEIKQDGKQIIINTKGYGHGVGMSQYGAQAMAKANYTYEQILKYYYQGVDISKI